MSLRYEVELIWTAVMFFTRLPVPRALPYSDERLQGSARYFPWIGWLAGGVAASGWALGAWLGSPLLAALFATAASVVLTGAFHEDGFADVCDGLGGAVSAERALEIMKDSRLGTYGTVGLGLLVATKVAALSALAGHGVSMLLIAGHTLSRLAAATVIHTGTYARSDDRSKSKPLSTSLSRRGLAVAAAGGLLPLLVLPGYVALLPLLALGTWAMKRWFDRRLGGYTGDCLGATQQVTEVLWYLGALALA